MIVVNPVFWILVFCAAFVLWLACGRLFHKIGDRAARIYEKTKENMDLDDKSCPANNENEIKEDFEE